MLEVEVHTATLLAELGDDTKLTACKEQLRAHIKAGGAPPMGYGAQAALAATTYGAKSHLHDPEEKTVAYSPRES